MLGELREALEEARDDVDRVRSDLRGVARAAAELAEDLGAVVQLVRPPEPEPAPERRPWREVRPGVWIR